MWGTGTLFLLRNNKPVGKPFSYYHPEIRIVHVGSFVNAFLFFLRMCDQRLLTYRQTGEYLHCTAVFRMKAVICISRIK